MVKKYRNLNVLQSVQKNETDTIYVLYSMFCNEK